MTGFGIFMLIMCLVIPVSMIGVGRFYMKGGPRQINGICGYRTTRSMKNQNTWEFAHRYSGKIWFFSGLAMLPISAVIFLVFVKGSTSAIGNAGLVIIIVQMAVMICVIPATEAALKRNFDDEGRRR